MQLAIINGSPRYKKSNSQLLTEHFLTGYNTFSTDKVTIAYLANKKSREKALEAFQRVDTVILIFPLYTDCMPGIVKEFIESLARTDHESIKKIGFIVQSGFPEAIHSVAVERYLEKLAGRLKCECLGTVIKGGVEGIQEMPPWMTKKLFRQFRELGNYFAKHQSFSPTLVKAFRKPYKFSPVGRFFIQMMNLTGLGNVHWNSELKKNGAFEDRFARPYAVEYR